MDHHRAPPTNFSWSSPSPHNCTPTYPPEKGRNDENGEFVDLWVIYVLFLKKPSFPHLPF